MSMLGLAILGHFVGDYLLQNDWMALNKKTSSFHCAVHCALWSLAVCLFSGWWVWFPVLFALHFIQDRTDIVQRWMRLIGQRKFMEPPCAPWSVIVVDNIFHILTLYAIARFIGAGV